MDLVHQIELVKVPFQKTCPTCQSLEKTEQEKEWEKIFPLLICICLKGQEKRFESASSKLHEAGLCRIGFFYRPEKPTSLKIKRIGRYGCRSSHKAVLSWAFLQNLKSVAVLEDDFLFLKGEPSRQTIQKTQSAFLKTQDMLLLGGIPICGLPVSTSLCKVKAVCMHAYIAKPQLMKRMFLYENKEEDEEAIDWYCMKNCSQHMMFPQYVVQSCENESNINQFDDKTSFLHDYLGSKLVYLLKDHSLVWEIFIYGLVPFLLVLCFVFLYR
jgi:hypothetical protein